MDCDPGQDDAIAILMAIAFPERFDILGITTVSGNVSLEKTTTNALKTCELAGRTDIPVYAGCSRHLVNDAFHMDEDLHGETGLGGTELPDPETKVQKEHAVDFLIEAILASPKKVTLAVTGPQTNIAMALIKDPRIKGNIEEIIFMGGALEESNITPSAEFNMYLDPEACRVVFTSGVKLTMLPLDITHKLLTSKTRLEKIRAVGNKQAEAVYSMLAFTEEYDMKRYGMDGGPVHDPSVLAFMLKPELFEGKDVYVTMDLNGEYTRGRTVIDWFDLTNTTPNIYVIRDGDVDGFFDLIIDCLKRYSTGAVAA